MYVCFVCTGVIIVFDPAHIRPDPSTETLYNYFVKKQNLKPSHCVLFANSRNNDQRNNFATISQVPVVRIAFVTCILFM